MYVCDAYRCPQLLIIQCLKLSPEMMRPPLHYNGYQVSLSYIKFKLKSISANLSKSHILRPESHIKLKRYVFSLYLKFSLRCVGCVHHSYMRWIIIYFICACTVFVDKHMLISLVAYYQEIILYRKADRCLTRPLQYSSNNGSSLETASPQLEASSDASQKSPDISE